MALITDLTASRVRVNAAVRAYDGIAVNQRRPADAEALLAVIEEEAQVQDDLIGSITAYVRGVATDLVTVQSAIINDMGLDAPAPAPAPVPFTLPASTGAPGLILSSPAPTGEIDFNSQPPTTGDT